MRALSAVSLSASVWLIAACSENPAGIRDVAPGPSRGGSGGAGSNGPSTTGGMSTGDTGIVIVKPPDKCKENPELQECKLVPSGPACGDGANNQPTEQCDDGNSVPGDGCTGLCSAEKYFACPPEGPCTSTIVCGDGVVGPGEACDDANQNGGDGCAAKCNLVEKGFSCRATPCIRVYVCGDGVTDPNEGCDDANTMPGDGCDRCRLETGFKCEGAPSACSPTKCGDGKVEGAESCDDGNVLSFDGCSATCQAEPNCKAGACASKCGDGIKLNEDCDDGNLRSGDGCSNQCKIEAGFTCENPGFCPAGATDCTLTVPAVFRDFAADGKEFQPNLGERQVVTPGLVKAQLDADGKPVFSGKADGAIGSPSSFQQWYRDSSRSKAYAGTITLYDNGKGGYVNRWGPMGEQWRGYAEIEAGKNVAWCGDAGTMCGNTNAECVPDATVGTVCADPCELNPTQSCVGTPRLYDGTPTFFPIDGVPSAQSSNTYALIPPAYGWSWAQEPNGVKTHNFHFTTEVRFWFGFDPSTPTRLDFTGDDDVWVFVNGQLAVDLGGWHPPLSGGVDISRLAGMERGKVYEIAVFHAERKLQGSSFRLTLSGFDLSPSLCKTNCGDGEVAAGEECDDGQGSNTGDYGKCSPSCTLGPRCGDSIIQAEYMELCDDGVNDGKYGGCAATCQLGPRCGDSITQPEHEQCDDGSNDGGYGECSAGCVLGPFCGDGVLTRPYEECDDENNEGHDGCSAACKLEVDPAR